MKPIRNSKESNETAPEEGGRFGNEGESTCAEGTDEASEGPAIAINASEGSSHENRDFPCHESTRIDALGECSCDTQNEELETADGDVYTNEGTQTRSPATASVAQRIDQDDRAESEDEVPTSIASSAACKRSDADHCLGEYPPLSDQKMPAVPSRDGPTARGNEESPFKVGTAEEEALVDVELSEHFEVESSSSNDDTGSNSGGAWGVASMPRDSELGIGFPLTSPGVSMQRSRRSPHGKQRNEDIDGNLNCKEKLMAVAAPATAGTDPGLERCPSENLPLPPPPPPPPQPDEYTPGAYRVHRRAPGLLLHPNQRSSARTVRGRIWAASLAIRSSFTRGSDTTEAVTDAGVADVEAIPVADDPVAVVLPESVVSSIEWRRKKRIRWGLALSGAALACLAVGLAAGLVGTSDVHTTEVETTRQDTPTLSPTPVATQHRPTLEVVAERGKLRCGMTFFPGFGVINDTTGIPEGFCADLCRAVAAAALGQSDNIEFVPVSFANSMLFTTLADRNVDLITATVTHTMERDIYQTEAEVGFSFTSPYYYGGLGFGGVPPFGRCADNLRTSGECKNISICVVAQTTHEKLLKQLFPPSIILAESADGIYKAFLNRTCNVIAGEQYQIAKEVIMDMGDFFEEYELGSKLFLKSPVAMMTRDDDHQWSSFVELVLQSLLAAEAQKITRAHARSLDKISDSGNQYRKIFVNAVAAVGNYGEMFDRNLGSIIPRTQINFLNTNKSTSGLIYAHPFGNTLASGPGPAMGGSLERILNRGYLCCGIIQRHGFGEFKQSTQEWSGMDVDYCRAVAASVFSGDVSAVRFVNFQQNVSEVFTALTNQTIDVMAGARVDFESSLFYDVPQEGYSFSQPYFYNTFGRGMLPQGPLAMMTHQRDPQWSSFVYWVVASTFFAEEESISRDQPLSSIRMPAVNLFGPQFVRMLRDPIIAVGNYGELYSRNLKSTKPRDGWNLLNNMYGPQHFALIRMTGLNGTDGS